MLHLQELAKQNAYSKEIILHERLPQFIASPCALNVHYRVEAKDNFYLIHLEVHGDLTVICQRCMQDFSLAYSNATCVAVARSEERAEQLLEHYECVVSSNWQVHLEDLVIDELHLYAPQFHQEITDCDQEINQFLAGVNEAS